MKLSNPFLTPTNLAFYLSHSLRCRVPDTNPYISDLPRVPAFLSGPEEHDTACIIQGHGRRLDDNNARRRKSKKENAKTKRKMIQEDAEGVLAARGKLRRLPWLCDWEDGCLPFSPLFSDRQFWNNVRGTSTNVLLYKWCGEGAAFLLLPFVFPFTPVQSCFHKHERGEAQIERRF